MTAHWAVLAAAALTTLVATTVAAALAVFTSQALPQAVRHDLVIAPGTALSVTTLVSTPRQAALGSAALRSRIAAAMPGISFSFHNMQPGFQLSDLSLFTTVGSGQVDGFDMPIINVFVKHRA